MAEVRSGSAGPVRGSSTPDYAGEHLLEPGYIPAPGIVSAGAPVLIWVAYRRLRVTL